MRYAVVLGFGNTLWDDLWELREWMDDERPTIIAVNDAGHAYPGAIHHWVTLHPEHLEKWQAMCRRRRNSYQTWSRRGTEHDVDHIISHWGVGSSGLFAVTVAFHLEIERVVLAGVPMTVAPHADGVPWQRKEVNVHWPGWLFHVERMRGRVKSMSGRTRELLGEPTPEWLYAEGPNRGVRTQPDPAATAG